jgi:hypothetical protein
VATYYFSIPIRRLIQKVLQNCILVVELSECTRDYGLLQHSLWENENSCGRITKRMTDLGESTEEPPGTSLVRLVGLLSLRDLRLENGKAD